MYRVEPVVSSSISIIVPCWHDSEVALARASRWARYESVGEVILAGVDGFAPGVVCESPNLRWCTSATASRGKQMNLGATSATGEVLLFHHLDSQLTQEHVTAIVEAMADQEVIGGGFYRKFDQRHPRLRWLERFERLHNRAFGTIYGDQSDFVRREAFNQLGGFAPIPLMEDVEFSNRLRRAGKIVLLDPAMLSSPRRQIELGAWRVTLRNLLFVVAFRCGVSAERLHRWYYGASSGQPSLPQERITSDVSVAE